MSKSHGTESITLNKSERTYRIEILSPVGGEYSVEFFRELVYVDDNGRVVFREILPSVFRNISQIADDGVNLGNNFLGCSTIAVALSALGDMFATIDAKEREDAANEVLPSVTARVTEPAPTLPTIDRTINQEENA